MRKYTRREKLEIEHERQLMCNSDEPTNGARAARRDDERERSSQQRMRSGPAASAQDIEEMAATCAQIYRNTYGDHGAGAAHQLHIDDEADDGEVRHSLLQRKANHQRESGN